MERVLGSHWSMNLLIIYLNSAKSIWPSPLISTSLMISSHTYGSRFIPLPKIWATSMASIEPPPSLSNRRKAAYKFCSFNNSRLLIVAAHHSPKSSDPLLSVSAFAKMVSASFWTSF